MGKLEEQRGEMVEFETKADFEVIKKEKVMDLDQASLYLTEKRIRKATSAKLLNQDEVSIFYETRRCPFCGNEIPNYRPYICTGQQEVNEVNISQKRKELQELLSSQVSLFPNNSEVKFQKPYKGGYRSRCPRCLNSSIEYGMNAHITISTEEQICTIIVEYDECQNIIVFNLSNGRVNTIGDTAIFDMLLSSYPVARRKIRQELMISYGAEFPFPQDEITFENLALATRWIGYPQSFYQGIPFIRGTTKLESSFEQIGKDLHKSCDIQQVFEKYQLPKGKSIKKAILQQPWQLFYYRELTQLHTLIPTPELFVSILKANRMSLALLLHQLHKYPKQINFLTDLKNELGEKKCTELMLSSTEEIFRYGSSYLCMAEEGQQIEHAKWHRKELDNILKYYVGYTISFLNYPRYSTIYKKEVLNHDKEYQIEKQRVGPYIFEILQNENAYVKAGNDLNNCLNGMQRFFTVVGIRKNNKYVGAVELVEHSIMQAKGYNNRELEKDIHSKADAELRDAYIAWKRKNNLEEDNDEP